MRGLGVRRPPSEPLVELIPESGYILLPLLRRIPPVHQRRFKSTGTRKRGVRAPSSPAGQEGAYYVFWGDVLQFVRDKESPDSKRSDL